MILLTLFSVLLLYLAAILVKQLVRNQRAFKFFESRAQNLAVLPSPNPFYGHVMQTWWNPRNYQLMHQLHAKYGPTIGFYVCSDPNVATCDLDLIKLVMLDQGDRHIDRSKLNGPYKMLNQSLILINGDAWRGARRAVGPSMTNRKVRSELVSADIEDIAGQLNGLLRSMAAKAAANNERGFEIDSFHMGKRYALAVIVLVMYKRNQVVDFESERDKWCDELADLPNAAANPLCLLAMMFPVMEELNYHLIKLHRISRHFNKVLGFINQAVEAQNNTKSAAVRRRLADEIIETYLARKLGVEALKGTLLATFLAGLDTTVGAINHLIWQLAWNPDIQDKLRAELLAEGLDSQYLNWCIHEGLRIHPPIPLSFGRVLAEDVHYKGTVIPKGTNLTSSVYTIHHDPAIWPEPYKFKPERWAEAAEFHPAAFLAFGLGQRNCVGAKLAMQETRIIIRTLLASYRIETCAKTPKTYDFVSPALISTQPLEATIVRLVPI